MLYYTMHSHLRNIHVSFTSDMETEPPLVALNRASTSLYSLSCGDSLISTIVWSLFMWAHLTGKPTDVPPIHNSIIYIPVSRNAEFDELDFLSPVITYPSFLLSNLSH